MSIYDSGPSPKRNENRNKVPPQKANPKDILNDKDLASLVKQIKGGPTTAKEILFDSDKNVIGVLQRNDTPFFLTTAQVKELEKLQGK